MNPPNKSHSGSLPFGTPQHPSDVYTANVDGAARGNPGPASYAVIVRGPSGAIEWQNGKYIGRTTNNVAEYYGLVAALDYATTQKIARLRVISDSELMVKQMQGKYRVKSPDLQPLHERARKLARGLTYFAIEHVRREHNGDADALANAALDNTSSTSLRDSSSSAASVAPASSSAGAAPSSSPSSSPRIAMTPHMRATSADRETAREQTVKARYTNGSLHPLEPIELAEGEIAEIRIRRKPGMPG